MGAVSSLRERKVRLVSARGVLRLPGKLRHRANRPSCVGYSPLEGQVTPQSWYKSNEAG